MLWNKSHSFLKASAEKSCKKPSQIEFQSDVRCRKSTKIFFRSETKKHLNFSLQLEASEKPGSPLKGCNRCNSTPQFLRKAYVAAISFKASLRLQTDL